MFLCLLIGFWISWLALMDCFDCAGLLVCTGLGCIVGFGFSCCLIMVFALRFTVAVLRVCFG